MEALVWIYMINATLLTVHEIDSAYWHEWKLFKLPGGIGGFLLIHLPLVFLILFGLVELCHSSLTGLIISLFLSLSGFLAFLLHMTFLARGGKEFRAPISIGILITIMVVSFLQAGITVYLLSSK
jgi:hypothetical protein